MKLCKRKTEPNTTIEKIQKTWNKYKYEGYDRWCKLGNLQITKQNPLSDKVLFLCFPSSRALLLPHALLSLLLPSFIISFSILCNFPMANCLPSLILIHLCTIFKRDKLPITSSMSHSNYFEWIGKTKTSTEWCTIHEISSMKAEASKFDYFLNTLSSQIYRN